MQDRPYVMGVGAKFLEYWNDALKEMRRAMDAQQKRAFNDFLVKGKAIIPIHNNMSTEKAPDVQEEIIANIARVCHEANRAYCNSIGDYSQVAWQDAPDWQKESAIKGVKHHLEHPLAGPEDSHNSWLKEKAEQGWKYGPVKDADKKEHPCFVQYEELPLTQQMKDYIFGGIAKSMIKAAGLRTVPTRGEQIMNVSFNPGGNKSVASIKEAFAHLYDLLALEGMKHRDVIQRRKNQEMLEKLSPEERAKAVTDGKTHQLQEVSIEQMDSGRLMAVAFTNIEQAQMWAVKSVTR